MRQFTNADDGGEARSDLKSHKCDQELSRFDRIDHPGYLGISSTQWPKHQLRGTALFMHIPFYP